jgi:hypothetical protein
VAPATETAQELRLPPDNLPPDNTVASPDATSADLSAEAFAPMVGVGELPQEPAQPGLSQLPGRFWPSRLPFQEGDPVPPGYRVEHSQSTGLIVGGGAVLGVAYAASVVAAMSDEKGAGWLWLPVVGPFGSILAQDVHCEAAATSPESPTVVVDATESARECSKKVVSTARRVTILLVDGLAQVAGGSLLVVGLSTRQRELVRDKAVLVTPRLVGGSYGLDFWGQF